MLFATETVFSDQFGMINAIFLMRLLRSSDAPRASQVTFISEFSENAPKLCRM
jgi:hypothetical protein